MDPFDEFEFKPLTDGLGFHKKQKSLKSSVESAQLVDRARPSLPDAPLNFLEEEQPAARKSLSFDDIVKSLDQVPLKKSGFEFSDSLPREKTPEKTPDFKMMEMEIPVQSPFPSPEKYRRSYTEDKVKKTPTRDQLSSVGTRRGAADSPKGGLQVSPGSLSSSILDLVVVMALGLIFTSCLLAVTKVELQTLIQSTNTDFMTQMSVFVLLVAVMQIYFIISRSFFGRTLGEWTFDLQLGRDEEHKNESYPMRVMMRSLLVTLTGVVLIPFLSFVFRRDLAGSVTGLKLYQQSI